MANLSSIAAFASFPVEEAVEYNVEVVRFEDDSTQAFKSSDTKSRKFRLRYESQSYSEMVTFRDFYDAVQGAYIPFTWDHPLTGETEIRVRFDDSKIVYSAGSPRTWDWTCVLVGVL